MSLAGNLSRNEARARAQLLTVRSYTVEVDLTDGDDLPSEHTFRSRTVVRFACAEPGATTHIDLTAASLRSATLNGAPVTSFDGHRLHLSALQSDNELVVEAEMAYTNTGAGLHRFVDPLDGGVYLYSQCEAFDAHRIYACFDQPDLKATFELTVYAPRDWVVVSNGHVTAAPASGDAGTWEFAATPALPTYITALVAGPFAHVHDEYDGIPLGLYCRRTLADRLDAAALFDLTKGGIDFYRRAFDFAFPFTKYDQLFVAEMLHGAMENAAAVTIDEGLLLSATATAAQHERRATVILHELAHMWFGNLVTLGWWDDLWLNESFATYASLLCLEEATDTDGWVTLASNAKAAAYELDLLSTTHPVVSDMADLEALRANFDAITYFKGAAVLKQLVALLGRDSFLAGVRRYFRTHAWANASLSDLLVQLEQASGRDLSQWATQWLETAGVNTLEPAIDVDATGVITGFAVTQQASPQWPTLRTHRIAIGLYDVVDGALARQSRHELDITGERTDVPELIGRQRPALVLVNDDDLTYTRLRLDQHSAATLVHSIGRLDEPLARALCWTAAWDMTRAAQMRARDYLALVHQGIDNEAEIGVVETLLDNCHTALTLYADPAWSPEGAAALAARAFCRMHTEQTRDRQRIWAQAAVALASTEEQLSELAQLLDDSAPIPGLDVDQELRWKIVRRLVAVGAADETAVEKEQQRDHSAEGQRQALCCLAARPTATAKEQAWSSVVVDDSLPQAVQAAVVEGFNDPAHAALLAPFTDRFFDMVADLWRRRGPALAHGVVVGLFPRYVVEREVADKADELLATGIVPDALARLVREGTDGITRALAARAFDRSLGG